MSVFLQVLGALLLGLIVHGVLVVLVIQAKPRQFGRKLDRFTKAAVTALEATLAGLGSVTAPVEADVHVYPASLFEVEET